MSGVHEYPSEYGPGTHWATDATWEILDSVKPGVLSGEVRAFLAGQIAGRLMKERQNCAADAETERLRTVIRAAYDDLEAGNEVSAFLILKNAAVARRVK